MTCTTTPGSRITLLMLATALTLATTIGCAGFSQVRFGPENGDKVREGDTIHQAITNYGKPDYIHDAKGDQLYVWRSVSSMGILGMYQKLTKSDLVVEVRDQTVQKVHWVPRGQGLAFAGVVTISTDELP